MVARAAYAVQRGFVAPERILLLAFNRDAAAELQERVGERFAAAGISSEGVIASTFHAFGLRAIGQATGRKPQLAPWVERNNGVDEWLRIVAALRETDATFRYRWDLYRLLFSHAPNDLNAGEPDGYDKDSGRSGYKTFAWEVVKSHGERLIADFLYLNGVRYEYERPYAFDAADAAHGQYRPDFYYPDINVWHEHWALDREGRAPESFVSYAEQMSWKRDLH